MILSEAERRLLRAICRMSNDAEQEAPFGLLSAQQARLTPLEPTTAALDELGEAEG